MPDRFNGTALDEPAPTGPRPLAAAVEEEEEEAESPDPEALPAPSPAFRLDRVRTLGGGTVGAIK